MDQNCIVTKSIPNFSFLAEYHNVSEDTLKQIIYKYRNEAGNDTAVPSNVYIQAQLGKVQYVDSNPNAKKEWDKHYSTSKEFSSIEKFQEAKKEALTLFPEGAVVGYLNNKNHWTLAVKEPVQKIIPKSRKDFPSWHDYNDYLLTMGDLIPEKAREKEEQLVGTQPFTFSDGTTVTVPFRPNSQQEEALNAMNDFLKSKATAMTLAGYAGTGKTSLMEIIAKKARKDGKDIVFSASTNQAAAVLRDRVKNAGFTANTLNKVFGISVEEDSRKPYDATNLVNRLQEAKIKPGTTVVIDEASMINEENYKILNKIARENALKIIYVGDKGQLPPVKESQTSKVFRDQGIQVVTLTRVERTGDNAILKEATDIRDGKPLSGESSFNKEGKGVAYIKNSNKDAKRAVVEKFVPFLKENPDYFRILAYHNTVVAKYNDAVRKTLGYTGNTPRVNEPIVGYDNWGYTWDKNGGTYKFINSGAYKVTKVGTPKTVSWEVQGTPVKMQAVPITIQDAMGNTQTINFMDVKGNEENKKNALILAREKARVWKKAMSLPKTSKERADLLKTKNDIENFLFVNDNIIDPAITDASGKHPTLQRKVFDFGYAMTVHKSQGSTFTHVMVDDADIATVKNTPSAWNSVILGEEVEDIEREFDEGSWTAEGETNILNTWNQPSPEAPLLTTPAPTTESNDVNLRQQLEYVAVSRATDTVTIIANDVNVKKEDSPLNHLPQVAETNTTQYKPEVFYSKQDAWEYQRDLIADGVDRSLISIVKTPAVGDYAEFWTVTVNQPDTINPTETRYTEEGKFISTTIAPYYSTSYEDYMNMSAEEQKKMREAFGAAAKKIANLLGISLDIKKASFNIGGYEFEETTPDGKTAIVEPSFTFRLDTTPEKARLFAALMGDLGFEQQEAVISQYKVDNYEDGNCIRHSIVIKDIDKILQELENFNIKNFTYDKTNGVLSILNFKEEDVEKFANLVEFLEHEGYELQTKETPIQSDYLEKSDREALYRERLEAAKGGDSRGQSSELYNVIQEALNKVAPIKALDGLELYSGGAIGSDTAWGKAVEAQGGKVKHFTVQDYDALPKETKDKIEREYQEVVQAIGRRPLDANSYSGKLVRRDMMQADASNTIIAIGSYNPQTTIVNGGTAYAVTRAILNRKAVYLFNQEDNTWNYYDYQAGNWWPAEIPIIDNKTALIGTRGDKQPDGSYILRDNAQQAILDVVNATINNKRSTSEIVDNITPSETNTFVPYPIQLSNLGIETGERVMQIDQAWKAPILLDLDSQLGMDISEEEKTRIIEQMHRVYQATSEEDYNNAPTKEREEVNDKMSDYWRRNNQMNALIDNEVGLEASEVKEIAEQVVNSISDIITEIQANPEKAKELFPTFNANIDLKNATRKEIVQAININNLIGEARKRFEKLRYDEDNPEIYDLYASDFDLMDQSDLILENWDTVMELAADVFVINEGFSIKRDTKKQSFETEEREFTGYDYDNYVDPQDEEAIREQEDEQEHWQVEARTIDAFNSMSDQVRLAYHNCYLLDNQGNKIYDKWGIPKRVNKVQAVSQTLRWVQDTLDLPQMVDKLIQRQPRNPWLQQLINRLKDDTGKETDFQSQFYGVMHRHFQLYDNVKRNTDGSFSVNALNGKEREKVVLGDINAQFQLGSHPMFTKEGKVKGDSLDYMKTWNQAIDGLVKKYNIRKDNSGTYFSNNVPIAQDQNPLSSEDVEIATKNITAVCRMLGFNISEDILKDMMTKPLIHQVWSQLKYIIKNTEDAVKAGETYNPFDYDSKNSIRGKVMSLLSPILEEMDDETSNAFFEDGKMYQSYVIPSFLTQLFDQFKQSPEDISQWLEKFYGYSEWFKDKDGNWRLEWLNKLANNPKARELFDHKVQLNFNKHSYMRNMSPEEFTLSVFTEYFSEFIDMKNVEETPAWFRVPIQSNKPSSEFIRFYADRSPAYKEHIVTKMYSMFLQELSRIDTVRKRNRKEGYLDRITSFDENGRKFHYLPFLNSYLMDNGKLVNPKDPGLFRKADNTLDNEKSNELKQLLNKKANAETPMSSEEDIRLMSLVQEATRNYIQQKVDNCLQNWEETGILKAAEKVKGIKSLNHTVRENLENFLWNDIFAANNILQLTIVDKAFYPNAVELQKRLAELHAPGTRGNKYATDYNGKRVSDGFYRTIILKDLDGFVANIIDNISVVFDRKIEAAPADEKQGLIALKESLVGEKGAYRRINVTDAQAYSSISSYRKKAFMFGKWSRKAEDIYQRLLKGDYTLTDLEVAFQPLKPFVYGHVSQNMGVENAPITKMPVPFQAKNAEYLLIMADALTRNEDTGRPNLLRVISNIMEESERRNPTKGIDTVQFESAIKSGNQGIIDLTPFLTMAGGEAGAYTLMESLIFQDAVTEDGTEYNYDAIVRKTDYDNYALQQEVPAHFREHEQAEGSQQRMNIPTDLDFYNYAGETNFYSWTDPDKTEHKLDAKEFRKEYERVHAANIEDSFNKLTEELHLNSPDKKARNLALSEILQEEIMSSPRYGIDLFQACQIDPATGEFRIPKGDPIQSKRIEQLINSIIKNRINKQKIAGGPIVQVSNFGTSKQLHIRFNDKKGNLLLTKDEFTQHPTLSKQYTSFKEYLKDNQAGIAHFEIFAPIGMKKLFDRFKNPDGSINLEAVEKCDPKLLKVITGRIPNEEKYSIAHGKIVGFMPALAGDAIMFPYELTEIDDSDFDVDKRYTMRKVIDIVIDWSKVKGKLVNAAIKGLDKFKTNNPEGYKKWASKKNMGQSDRDVILNQVDMFMDNPEMMKDTDALMASMYQEYQRILHEEYPYKTKYPKKGTRDANNNQIVDMCWAVMSNEMTADKILNPGGFEIPKHTAYVIAVYKSNNGTISWETLDKMSTKELQKMANVERDLAWFPDHVQFYKQNAAGSNLIGVFAVNKVAHATLEGDGLLVNMKDFCGEDPFAICDMEFEEMMPVDNTKDMKGMLIGKSIGSGIGASADTAKDPWLDSININMTTAGMFNTLLRMGMPMEDAELFMAQDVILRLMNEFNRKSLEGTTTIDNIIQQKLNYIKEKYGYTEDSIINKQPITREELRKGLLPVGTGSTNAERETIDYKVLLAFAKIKTLAKAIRKPTTVTRLNSISSAVGPLIIDNIILEHKLNEFLQVEEEEPTGFYHRNPDGTYSYVDMDDILADHPILNQFSRPIDSRKPDCPTQILFSDMPAGSSLFKTVLKALPGNISDRIYDDRQLLSKLSDFFQSYLLVANGVINPQELEYYIREFPKEFVGEGKGKGIKAQYPNNAFIQAIETNYEKKSGRVFLNVNTTGMKEQQKERLKMAWIDLHKTNPELSTKLFTYAFFRGGIGFSPKTFMGLVPTYVKEHLSGYVDTYRHFPKIMEDLVVEQFVRNNWDNTTLVPRKGGEGTTYDYSQLSDGKLYVRAKKDKASLEGIKYMKTVTNKETIMWKRTTGTDEKGDLEFIRIYPLGNNGEYMEMSTKADMKVLEETTVVENNNEVEELPETSPIEADAAEVDTPTQLPESVSQQSKNLSAFVPLVIARDPSKTTETATKHLENYRDKVLNNTITRGGAMYLVNLFRDMGLHLTPEEAIAEFKKFC